MLGFYNYNLKSETLKLTRDNQRDKKRCETLNDNLKEKLELISQNSFEENATKVQFMKGANWMGN